MFDIIKDKYDFVKVIKIDRDGVYIDVGFFCEVLVLWEDLLKFKEFWFKVGDYLLVILRIDSMN